MQDNKVKVLLIDDDELLLRALNRSFKRLYEGIAVVCLQNSSKFLQTLEEKGVPDIIFCDSLMPVVSGHVVLEQAKEQCPTAVRCLLTGYLKDEFKSQVKNTIHFHLVKPFTQLHLKKVVDSAIMLKSLPIQKNTRTELGQISYIPFLSTVAQQVIEELNKDDTDVNRLAKTVEHDGILTGKLLQLANSAFMGYHVQTSNVKEAITRIGLDPLLSIVTCHDVTNKLEKVCEKKLEAIKSINDIAYKKAIYTKSLAKHLNLDREEQLTAFAVAILSAIGGLIKIMLSDVSDDLANAALTAYMLSIWGFEEKIVRAQLINDIPVDTLSITLIHSIANRILESGELNFTREQFDMIDELGLLDKINEWSDGLDSLAH